MENNMTMEQMQRDFEAGFNLEDNDDYTIDIENDPYDRMFFGDDDDMAAYSDNNAFTAEATKPPAANNPAEDDNESVNINCDGMDIKMSRKEMISYAKRGMRRNEDSLLDTLAEHHGMQRDEFVKYLERDMENMLVQEKLQQGIPLEAARRIAALEMNEKRYYSEQRVKAAKEKHERFKALAKEYPNLKELPPQVIKAIREGRTPLEAYREYDMAGMKQELERSRNNSRNRAKAIGSMADSAASPPLNDFLIGWESV